MGKGFSSIRSLTRGEFDASLRELRQERPKPSTDREAWKKEQVEKALNNPRLKRRF